MPPAAFCSHDDTIRKILLARPSFRMGNSILATPLIFLFRQNFPNARIDFVGTPISGVLFKNLPIDHHYEITRRLPNILSAYLKLIREIRAVGYDLAVELSGSQSAMGAWIVGWSGSRFRVGMIGKRDRWFDVKLPKPQSRNKYELCSALALSMGLSGNPPLPKIILSASEREEALRKTARLLNESNVPDVGVFVGGRVRKHKRWHRDNFVELVKGLRAHKLRVILFVGPEEEDLIEYLNWALTGEVPVIYERSIRLFAAMVSICKLFVAGDGGPMHLACALGVRTVAMFQKDNFEH